jgi:WD40 repeat protein
VKGGGQVKYLAFSARDSSLLAVTDRVSLWDTVTEEEYMAVPFQDSIRADHLAACFSPDGEWLARCHFVPIRGPFVEPYSPVVVWDLRVGKALYSWTASPTYIYALAFSPNGDLLATGGWGVDDIPQIKLWSLPK